MRYVFLVHVAMLYMNYDVDHELSRPVCEKYASNLYM